MEDFSLSQKLKYYGPDDLATFLNAKDVLEFVSNFDPEGEYNLNEILALRNCNKYLTNQKFINSLGEDARVMCAKKKGLIEQKIGHYWAGVTQENFRSLLANVDEGFCEDLIEPVMQYSVYKVLSDENIMELLDMNGIPLYYKLKNKRFVRRLEVQCNKPEQ